MSIEKILDEYIDKLHYCSNCGKGVRVIIPLDSKEQIKRCTQCHYVVRETL